MALAVVLGEGDVVAGRVIEPNSFGDDSSPSLDSFALARAEGDRVHLLFRYDGTAGVDHAVANELRWTRDGLGLVGRWTTGPGWTGDLFLRKVADAHREPALEPRSEPEHQQPAERGETL